MVVLIRSVFLFGSVLSIEVEDISGKGGVYIQSDGEHLGFLPKKICVLPAAIEMICWFSLRITGSMKTEKLQNINLMYIHWEWRWRYWTPPMVHLFCLQFQHWQMARLGCILFCVFLEKGRCVRTWNFFMIVWCCCYLCSFAGCEWRGEECVSYVEESE